MKRRIRLQAFLFLLGIVLAAVPGSAGPDKVKFPEGWKGHVLYTTVDRYDIKQYRELFASSQAAVDAMKAGRPLPDGTVLTLIQYKAQVDAAGTPVKGPNGRFVKGDIIALTVMEKRAGFGTEYPPELRNGDWEYAAFSPAGVLNDKANYKGCFECHKPHERQDFVISLAALRQCGPDDRAQAGRQDRRLRFRSEQGGGDGGPAGDLGQRGRLAPSDHHRQHQGALADPDQRPESRHGLHDPWHLRLRLWAAPPDEGRDRGEVTAAQRGGHRRPLG